MAIFGSKCARCGKTRTRREEEGLPTCDDCAAKLQAQREEPRPCPIDGTPMEKLVRSNVVIDRCPTCRGIWLDRGELKLLAEAARDPGGSDFASGFVLGMVIG